MRTEENVQMALSKSAISSPLENLFSSGALSGDWLQLQPSQGARDCKVKYRIGGSDANPNLYFESVCGSGETNKPTFKGTQPGNSISSMSSEVFGRKCKHFRLDSVLIKILVQNHFSTAESCSGLTPETFFCFGGFTNCFNSNLISCALETT